MRVHDWQVRIIQLLAVPGLLLAFYLWLFHNGSLIAVCGPSAWDDCGAVSGPDAPYSSVGPIPVAAIGFVGYAIVFGLIWLRHWVEAIEDYLPELLVGVTGIAFLFSLYLTVLELFVIHALCRYCIVSAVIVTVMLLLSLSYMRSISSTDEEYGDGEQLSTT